MSNDHLSPERSAVQAHVRSRVVRLVDFADQAAGGTAVKIALGGKFFLATAAHVIPPSHDIRALIPVAEDEFVSNFTATIRDTENDVGLLELTPDDAGLLKGTFVSSEEIAILDSNASPHPVIVVGYPGQLINTADRRILVNAVAAVHDFRTLTFFGETILPDDWPTNLEQAPTRESDVFVRFNPHVELQRLKSLDPLGQMERVTVDRLNPSGMSGGGIWLEEPVPESVGIWHPKLRLAAIQVSASKPRAIWMRGTLIKQWLELVKAHYKSLRDSVDAILNG